MRFDANIYDNSFLSKKPTFSSENLITTAEFCCTIFCLSTCCKRTFISSKQSYLPPKSSTAHIRSDNLSPRIHSPSEKFWELSFNVGDKRNLFSLVSKECCFLNGLDIANGQTNLRRDD